MAWPCRTVGAALPCGLDPAQCPAAKRPRRKIETDPQSRLLRHFERPGTAFVFGPEAGCGRRTLAARLREAGVEVVEVDWDARQDPEGAEWLAQRMASARARGEKIAVFAPGLKALRRWSEGGMKVEDWNGRPALRRVEGGWLAFRDEIRAGSSGLAGRLVMALGIADDETSELFGLRQGEILGPQKAAVLLEGAEA